MTMINRNAESLCHTHAGRVQSHDGTDNTDAIPMIQVTGGWLKQFGFEVKQALRVTVSERQMLIEVQDKK
ncbi:hypothetical protein VA7868_04535 [Vibrio aerogenes CECT 7868]|uniref:Toxin SymE-like domain-containing protein n=1 Tax=Vibrio aerogenes CECT 7868 TaxID=1216006 RepID=A0A1M6EWI4_9VIBR|nr:SymE family type I addiction module toxin [Vibrio aerogenes]SHI89790.1 hypothetical protein VA7868_04535 [Vibrio aerogenes CECT 7868]